MAVYLYIAFALAPAGDRAGAAAAWSASLRRSRALVRGAWWRTFGILLLVNLIAQVIAGILGVPFTVLTLLVRLGRPATGPRTSTRSLPLLVTALGTIVASAVTWPFTAVSTALLYVDRRMRREALDLELARAAGVAPAASRASPSRPRRDRVGPGRARPGRGGPAGPRGAGQAGLPRRRPGLVERLVRWLLEQAGRLLDAPPASRPAATPGWSSSLLLVAVAVVAVRLQGRSAGPRAARDAGAVRRPARAPPRSTAPPPTRTPPPGEWAEAVRERLRAVVRVAGGARRARRAARAAPRTRPPPRPAARCPSCAAGLRRGGRCCSTRSGTAVARPVRSPTPRCATLDDQVRAARAADPVAQR